MSCGNSIIEGVEFVTEPAIFVTELKKKNVFGFFL